jgi:hypothetical protein
LNFTRASYERLIDLQISSQWKVHYLQVKYMGLQGTACTQNS